MVVWVLIGCPVYGVGCCYFVGLIGLVVVVGLFWVLWIVFGCFMCLHCGFCVGGLFAGWLALVLGGKRCFLGLLICSRFAVCLVGVVAGG